MIRLQSMRYERKFIVDESKAASILEFAKGYVVPDKYNDGDQGYLVCSVYLDSPDLTLYRQKSDGLKNRFKLRARFYSDAPGNPVFLEVKRRENDVIRKCRAATTQHGAQLVLRGMYLGREDLIQGDDTNPALHSLDTFCQLRDRLMAQPRTFVIYRREAYVSSEANHVRITFDRQLAGQRWHAAQPWRIPAELCQPPMPGVILELKFTDRFPNWMNDLVRVFDLQRVSVPKYTWCSDAVHQMRSPIPSSRFVNA